jgi:hypothetical protein
MATTYYLDTNSGFFYKINNNNTCSIEAWSSTGSKNGIVTNFNIVYNRTITNYTVTKITSITKSSIEFPAAGDIIKNTNGTTLGPEAYKVSPFTGTTVTIPISVKTIDTNAFAECTSLISIIYSGDLTGAVGTTGTSPLIQYAEPAQTTLVKYFNRGSTSTSYTIPSRITTINNSAFNTPQLTSIIYSGDLTGAIGASGTSPLIQYQDSEKKKIIKYFQRASTETTFKSGDYPTVNSIIPEAFTFVSNLVKIVINSNVVITQNAFVNCPNLKGIIISSQCTLQTSIISGSTLDYVLISSNTAVIFGNSNTPSVSSPVFPSGILTSTNYCVVSKENREFVDTLFGKSTKLYIEDTTNSPAPDTETRVYIRPATYNSIKTALGGESNDIMSVSTSIDFDNQIDTDNARVNSAAAAASELASTQLTTANANTSAREAKLLNAIQNKIRAIDSTIRDITGEQALSNRKVIYFDQDKYINLYVNRIGVILYYIVFILLALSFYLNRESYSIIVIVISLIIFALLPFVIKYITRFAYEQFLGLLKMFYKGNALYLDP